MKENVNDSFDIAVIGGGPAGLTFTRFIDSRNFSVALFERDNLLKEKPCAGVLSLRTLTQFDIPEEKAERKITGIRVYYRGLVREISYNRTVMLNFDRSVLNKILVSYINREEIHLFERFSVTQLYFHDDYWYLDVRNQVTDKHLKFKAKLIIGADGVNSIVAKATNIRKVYSPNEVGLSVQYWYELPEQDINAHFDGFNEIYYGRDVTPFGYAWVVPNKTKIRIGVGALTSKIDRNLKSYLDSFVSSKTFFGERLEKGRIINYQSGMTPLCGVKKPSYGKNAILVGDAAGHALPITGEGIAYAMRGGKIAAEIINKSLKSKRFTSKVGQEYERRWLKDFGSDLKWGHFLMRYFMRKTTKDTKSKLLNNEKLAYAVGNICLLYTSPSPRDLSTSRMPSSA